RHHGLDRDVVRAHASRRLQVRAKHLEHARGIARHGELGKLGIARESQRGDAARYSQAQAWAQVRTALKGSVLPGPPLRVGISRVEVCSGRHHVTASYSSRKSAV